MICRIDPGPYEAELAAASQRAAVGVLPPQLKLLAERHLDRLSTLVETMRMAGIDEDLVRHSVREIIDSYETQLVDALLRLSEEPR